MMGLVRMLAIVVSEGTKSYKAYRTTDAASLSPPELNEFSEEERKSLKWKNFDLEKALVATVVSVLKPGKTNTTSIADNHWVSENTQQQVPVLASFIEFLNQLLAAS